jgi:hypothetical protein
LAELNTTTTTQTSTTAQDVTNLVVSTQTSTQTVGNYVTDVSINPYIKSQTIYFSAYNLRPGQTIHAFFDKVLVDQYCAPGDPSNPSVDSNGLKTFPLTAAFGSPLVVDSKGRLAGAFTIPEGMFKTGDRTFELADADNLAAAADAISTKAFSTFTGSHLTVTKQAVTLTTINPVISTSTSTITSSSTQSFVNTQTIPDNVITQTIYNDIANTTTIQNPSSTVYNFIVQQTSDTNGPENNSGAADDPIAQFFRVNTGESSSGVFATSLEIYFKQKPATNINGVTVYICELNNGYPDSSKILPYSIKHLTWDNIVVTTDSTTSTKFTFDCPIFMNNNKEYAFVVKPDNNDVDYWVYSAELGEVDPYQNIQVSSIPVVGTAFYSATEKAWTALQTEYIKFKLNVALFATSDTGTAYFNNDDKDYLTVYNVGRTAAKDITPGDYVFQASNSTPSTANTKIFGVLKSYDDVNGIMYVLNTSGNNYTSNTYLQVHRFANSSVTINGTNVNTSTIIAWANTGSFHTPVIDAAQIRFAPMTPGGTNITYGYQGTSNAYVTESGYNNVVQGYEREFRDQERIVASYSDPSAPANYSAQIKADLSTISVYTSPVIDLTSSNMFTYKNLVDPVAFNYGEYLNNGNSSTKYVSQVITLAPGQDAQDLQVIVTGSRPVGTDIKVYAKFLNAQDGETIIDKSWSPLYNSGYDTYTDPANIGDVKEYTFKTFPYYGLVKTSGTISTSGTTVTGVGTAFDTELAVGWYINMAATATQQETSRKVVAIANSTSLTLDSAFTYSYSGQPYYLVPPPTTAYRSKYSNTALAGTVSTYTTNNSIIGNGTNFTGDFRAGSIIYVNGDSQVITSIANSTLLYVGKPWTANNSSNVYSIQTLAGMTYLNNNNNLYTNYKQFQLKVILQSNDSSKVPILQDVSAVALQL